MADSNVDSRWGGGYGKFNVPVGSISGFEVAAISKKQVPIPWYAGSTKTEPGLRLMGEDGMFPFLRAVVVLVIPILLAVPARLPAAERLALVIGNSAYGNSPLVNPVNDATDIAAALKKTGFRVILKTDAGRREMIKAMRAFGDELGDSEVGLFYFAGHGLQIDGRNYLIPVDATIESESDVEFEAVDAGRVLGKMEDAANGLNIIILDACRDNPFARSFRSGGKGLAKMDAPVGSLLAYATAPGSLAADGTGRNGLYTSKLLEHMTEAGLKLEDLFKKVRRDVMQASGGKQVPWESSSLSGDFFFTRKEAPPSAPAGPTAAELAQIEILKAEKARLEAERARLEAEKRMLEEKQRLEAEKLKMQLEMERLKTEKARLAADQQIVAERQRQVEAQTRAAELERQRLASQQAAEEQTARQQAEDEAAAAARKQAEAVRLAAQKKLQEELQRLKAEKEKLAAEKEQMAAQREAAASQSTRTEEELQALEARRQSASEELMRMRAEKKSLAAEKAKIEAQRRQIAASREEAARRTAEAEAEREAIESRRQAAMAEMKRIEAEKMRLAEEKTRIAAEAEAMRAAIPNGMASRARRLALFPSVEKVPSTAPRGPSFLRIWRRAIMNNLMILTDEIPDVEFTYSYYDRSMIQDTFQRANRMKSIADQLASDAEDMWQRKSIFSSLEPNLPKVVAAGRRIGAQLIVMYRVSIVHGVSLTGGTADLSLYLIDVEDEKIYRHSKPSADGSSETKPMIKTVLEMAGDSFKSAG